MTLWDLFFGLEKTEAPQLPIEGRVLLLLLVGVICLSAARYYQNKTYQKFFQLLQILQLLALYGWYWSHAFPLSESLPLYHCRLAMFAVLFLPNKSIYKRYFALLGVFGSIAAFVDPIFDPYAFPHITILSFILGHFALLGNSLNYLLAGEAVQPLNWQKIMSMTFVLNAFLLFVDQVLQANYGFLDQPPLIGNHGPLLNFLLVSVLLTLAISLVSLVFKRIKTVREVSVTQ